METFSTLLALCAGNSPVTGEFPTQRPVTRSFDISLICAWINGWVNNRETGNFRRHRANYDVTVMKGFLHFYGACHQASAMFNHMCGEVTRFSTQRKAMLLPSVSEENSGTISRRSWYRMKPLWLCSLISPYRKFLLWHRRRSNPIYHTHIFDRCQRDRKPRRHQSNMNPIYDRYIGRWTMFQ